jgi:hypothetical protein
MPLEVSMELQPKWGGFLGIDGKVIRVKGDTRCLLIGVDQPTQDLVHALVLDARTADGFAQLATEARLDAGHPLTGVVSDLGPGFAQSHRDHFGSVPFQACRVHFDRRLDQEIPKSLWSVKAPLSSAPSISSWRRRQRCCRRWDNYITENVIKQLNKKLRLMEGFESIESAERYARLLVGCYRFKRFTDSRNGNNGKAPLEAGASDCRLPDASEVRGVRTSPRVLQVRTEGH